MAYVPGHHSSPVAAGHRTAVVGAAVAPACSVATVLQPQPHPTAWPCRLAGWPGPWGWLAVVLWLLSGPCHPTPRGRVAPAGPWYCGWPAWCRLAGTGGHHRPASAGTTSGREGVGGWATASPRCWHRGWPCPALRAAEAEVASWQLASAPTWRGRHGGCAGLAVRGAAPPRTAQAVGPPRTGMLGRGRHRAVPVPRHAVGGGAG